MTIKVESIRFRVRGGTSANLATVNEVPLARELVVETDTGRMKLGNGTAAYSSLPYLTTGGVDVEFRVSGGYIQVSTDGGTTWENLVALADLKGNQGDPGVQGEPGPPGPSSETFPTFSFDGGLSDVAVGSFADLYVPFGFDFSEWTLLADSTGIMEVDLRACPVASHPPSSLQSICGSSRPKLLGQDKAQDAILAGWSVSIPSGYVLRAVITACSGVKRANMVMRGVRT